MRRTKTLGIAGALLLSALVGGTLIGSALATDEEPSIGSGAGIGAYCDTFMSTFADELGVSQDALVPAGQAAANAAIDAAVEAGDLTEERADALRERIASYDGEGCAFLGSFRAGVGAGFGHGWARGMMGGDVLEAAAEALGIESSALIEKLPDADSLEALATEQGVAYDEVRASILAAVQADLDAAVAEGMDQGRADAVVERLTRWLEEGGELRPLGRGHVRLDRGWFGPWHFGDDGDAGSNGEDSGA